MLDIPATRVVVHDDVAYLAAGEGGLVIVDISDRSQPRILSRDQLMDLTKGQDWYPTDRSIDNQIARLRKKIESDPKAPTLIKTVRGAGYSFTANVEQI